MARAVNSRMGASHSAPGPGTQGTMGGIKQAIGGRPGSRSMALGDEAYLWILVFLEVGAIAYLRNTFSRYHGG